MHTTIRLAVILALAVALAGIGGARSALAALPATPCTGAGSGTVTCDLWATTGTVTLPDGATVDIWGYADSASGAASLPGPILIAEQGDEVTINLTNELTVATAMLFPGQNMIPDTTGAAANGGTTSYTFTASQPGTYLYEASPLNGTAYQPAMGLYGMLVVHSATAGQAYGNANTAFNDEAMLVLSDIDPALNASADPAAFDMREYAPKYFLINGKAHPATDLISVSAGDTMLLRYVNAGLQAYSMSLLGLRQSAIAMDGSLFSNPRTVVAETIAPGQTADMLVTVPATAADGSRYALFDANLMLHNNSQASDFGGMLTFLEVTGTTPGGDTTGPLTSAVVATPNSVSATISDAGRGDSNITAAEYFVDTTGANGNGTALTGAFASSTENVSGAINPVLTGTHIIYVHGQDAAGNWGPFQAAVVSNDTTGPVSSGLALSPNPANGTANVTLTATGDDSASGGSNITTAEYSIDGGPAVAMTVTPSGAKIASLSAVISAATVTGLSDGSHTISVRSQDSANNWGALATTTLVVDKAGPATSNVLAAPNPNNGKRGLNSTIVAVRVTATFEDSITRIGAAEGFIDNVGANGSGIIFIPKDGLFNTQSEQGYADIPLATINALSDGDHTIYVHGKDAAGNWGATSSTVLTIDKTAPTISSVTATPNPASGNVTLTATATDAATGVNAAEWFTGADPGIGNATAMTVSGSGPWSASATFDVSGWAEGSYSIYVRVRDAAGNWSSTANTVLAVVKPLYFSTFGNSNPPGVGGAADDADIYYWDGTAFSRSIDASGPGSLGLPNGANVDGFDRVDATHFYMSFSGQVTVPGLGNVQDEDVVYYNAGVWSLYFDGSANGVGGTDLDAINIVGGTLYFSTDDNDVPPGAGGSGDDADIYRWNGGSSYTRIWDASANGLPGGADVDGLVFVDATHFYVSFNATTTTVPGLGAVEDEDVVYYNAGVWSVYFDGTSRGLTSGNHDIDAFDLP